MEKDFSKDIHPNKYDLDGECEKQSNLYFDYMEELSKAKTERDRAKIKLKQLSAVIELEYRKNPPKEIKITESVIESLVQTDKRVKEQEEILIKMNEIVFTLENAVEAIKCKKSMIQELDSLWMTGYYSVPKRGNKENLQGRLIKREREEENNER